MDNPITHLHLDHKLGPLSRGKWLGIVVVGGGGYYAYRRHQATVADAATATDATTAGSSPDDAGYQTDSEGSDDGTTPMSLMDPYTSGYGGGGEDVLLGTGGVVSSVGASDTPVAPIIEQVGAQNPASPGANGTAPAVTINYPQTATAKVKNVGETSAEVKKTVAAAVKQAMHNMKNGRPPTKHTQKAAPKTRKATTTKKHNKKVVDKATGGVAA